MTACEMLRHVALVAYWSWLHHEPDLRDRMEELYRIAHECGQEVPSYAPPVLPPPDLSLMEDHERP